MKTPYDISNSEFSNMAHEAAKSLIYPQLFGMDKDSLTFTSTLVGDSLHDTILDGEMGIDRIVYVRKAELQQPLKFTIQERFRREDKAHYRDLTITEWSHNSDLPSELYKIGAGIFVYGYYSTRIKDFIEVIGISVPNLLLAICKDEITYTREANPRSNQTFLVFTFDELIESGCALLHQDKRVRQLTF